MKQRSIFREPLVYLCLGLIVFFVSLTFLIFLIFRMTSPSRVKNDVTYADIVRYFQQEQVREVVVSPENVITMKILENGTEKIISYKLRDPSIFYNDCDDMINSQVEAGVIQHYEWQPTAKTFGNVLSMKWTDAFLMRLCLAIALIILFVMIKNAVICLILICLSRRLIKNKHPM